MPRDDGDGLGPAVGGTFAALAPRLAELGYSPIPLDGKAPAKGKALCGWSRRRDPDPAWIAEQVRAHPAANTGIVCGRVVAVDIDVLDPELADRLDALAVRLLGDAPLRIGQWPKRLRVYQLAEPLRKRKAGAAKGAQVEVLACGQQFAAYGTHPDTGAPYTWPEGGLSERPLDDLPVASPEALRRFLAEAEALLPRREDAPARARAQRTEARADGTRSGGGGGAGIAHDLEGLVADGRDEFMSRIAFHTVHDAIARRAPLDERALGATVWTRFREGAVLDNAKGTGRPWSEGDALRKVRDKLRLHRAGALPGRESDAPVAAVPPFHPAPTGTAAEARAEVERQVRGFLARTLEWQGREAAARAERERVVRAGRELAAQVGTELAVQVAAELAAQLGTGTAPLVAPEHAALAVEVAAGKTTLTCAELPGFTADAKARGLPDRVLYLVPTHKLGDEILGLLEGLGLDAAAWRGREATHPGTGRPMCANLDAVREAIAAMQDVEQAVCGKAGGGPRCPFFDDCPYQRQKMTAGLAEVVVAAHETMLGSPPAGIGRGFGLVVVDEGWWQDGVEPGRALGAETLRVGEDAHPVPRLGDPDRRDEEATERLRALRRKMAAAVEASPDGYLARGALEAAGLTAAECGEAVKLEWRRKVEDAMRPGMPEAARREAAGRCAGNAAIPRLAALWKEAGALLEGEGEATGRVEFDTRDGAEGRRRVVLLNTARPVAEAVAALPMLLLDATLPEALLRHRLPDLRVLAEVRAAAPHMRVRQILGGFGKTSLVPHPKASEAENRRRERRIAKLRRFVAARSGAARTLLVTYKELEPRFAGLPGVETAHFNAVAGRDEWGPGPDREGVRHLFVVGRPLPAPGDVRRLAAALTGRPVPREQPGRVVRGAAMRDGAAAAVPVRVYEDPDLEAVRAAITDAELVQVIGRGRGLNREATNPLEVWLLAGDAVVALPVDELARWEDVAPVAGPRERMAERGVVLESPADAARAYPDLFPSAEAAKKALQRGGAGGDDFGDNPLCMISVGKCPPNTPTTPPEEGAGHTPWVRVEYRPPGRGQQTRTAWAQRDRLPGLRAWLEGALGVALAAFSVDGEAPRDAQQVAPSPDGGEASRSRSLIAGSPRARRLRQPERRLVLHARPIREYPRPERLWADRIVPLHFGVRAVPLRLGR